MVYLLKFSKQSITKGFDDSHLVKNTIIFEQNEIINERVKSVQSWYLCSEFFLWRDFLL